MDKKQHFIRTTDEDTAKSLREAGFTELKKEGSVFVFLNDWSKNFSKNNIDEKKVNMSNRVCI